MIIDKAEDELSAALHNKLIGKAQKAHAKGIVAVRFVVNERGNVLLVTVGHDAIKMWNLTELDASVSFCEVAQFSKWRCGVQSADVLVDGTGFGVLGIDSMLYYLTQDEENQTVVAEADLGYMESWHVLAKKSDHFLTVSFSGFISEVVDGVFTQRVSYPRAKNIISIALSPRWTLLAVSNSEGAVDILDGNTFKSLYTFEAHAMKIRVLLFLSESQLLTGSDDRTIRLYRLTEGLNAVRENTFCGQKAPVVALAAPIRNNALELRIFASGSSQGHVRGLSWSPCCQFVISGGEDKQLLAFRVLAEPIRDDVPLIGNLDDDDEVTEPIRDDVPLIGNLDDDDEVTPMDESYLISEQATAHEERLAGVSSEGLIDTASDPISDLFGHQESEDEEDSTQGRSQSNPPPQASSEGYNVDDSAEQEQEVERTNFQHENECFGDDDSEAYDPGSYALHSDYLPAAEEIQRDSPQ